MYGTANLGTISDRVPGRPDSTENGDVLTSCNINIQYAQWAAGMNGQCKDVISKEEYQRRFGRPFSPDN